MVVWLIREPVREREWNVTDPMPSTARLGRAWRLNQTYPIRPVSERLHEPVVLFCTADRYELSAHLSSFRFDLLPVADSTGPCIPMTFKIARARGVADL